MVLVRLACASLLLAGAACKQSPFDNNVDEASGDIDAAVTPTIDAAPGTPDAPSADASPDDTDAGVDDGPPCPVTCQGDAARDFDGSPFGSNSRWRYVTESARVWTPMLAGSALGVDGFVGTGDPAPAVLDCYGSSPAPTQCANNETALLLVSAAAGDAALEFTIPANGAYTLAGDFRAVDTGSNHRIVVYRNMREDVVFEQLFPTDTTMREFSVDVDAMAGDRIVLTAFPDAGTAIPVAVHMFVSEAVGSFPRDCGVTLRFESDTPPMFSEECGLVEYTGKIGDSSTNLTDAAFVQSVVPEMGQAWSVTRGHYLHPTGGASMDHSGDFTIQMWVQVPDPHTTFQDLYADEDSATEDGINLAISSGFNLLGLVLFPPSDELNASFAWPDDDEWHFLRVVRNTSNNTFRMCLDGQLKSQQTLAASANPGATRRPFIGRNVVYSPPALQGAIDDVRVFKRAYPCGPP